MKRLAELVFWLVFAIPVAAAGQDLSGCIICHNSMAGKVVMNGNEIDLNVDGGKFQKSVHGFLACTDCHERFDHNPHKKPALKPALEVALIAEKISAKAKKDPVAQASCTKCHGEVYSDVLGSVHGGNIIAGHQDGALCADCHGSPHYIVRSTDATSPINNWNVVETCGSCHADKELSARYGIEGDVMKTYMESFHGRKHILGHKKAPTCISCHGYHAINSKENPESPVIGKNKLETCGKCHKGANEKFVAAITHQEAGQIPHLAEKTLIVLTISVFIFIVLHVFLEIFSEARDYFFRRKKEEEDEESTEYNR